MNRKLAILAGVLLLLILTGCGPKGGTITLVNESSHSLNRAYISMGENWATTLYPGQWIRSKYDDENRGGFSVAFGSGIIAAFQPNDVIVTGVSGSWSLNRWYSELIRVQDGESVIVTVRDAPAAP
jgi:hypothetical protein